MPFGRLPTHFRPCGRQHHRGMLDVRHAKVFSLVLESRLARPACFPDDESWAAYLAAAQASGEALTRRQDTGNKARGTRTVRTVLVANAEVISPHCLDCDWGGQYQTRMRKEGRCDRTERPQAPPEDQPERTEAIAA